MGSSLTRRKPRNASRPRGEYDPYADELTRPDIVPAALRFAHEGEDLSSILERREREAFAQSDWRELRNRNEATVVDGPLQRPSGPATRAPSQNEKSDAPALQRSGPRHRAPLPTPPSGVVQNARAAALHTARREEQHQHQERAGAVPTPRPVPRNTNRALVFLLVLLTAVASAAVGTSLADGALKRVVDRIASNFSETTAADQPLPLPASVPTSVPPSAVTRRQSAPPTSSDEVSEVPVVRLEDLPVSTQDERETKTKGKTKRTVRKPRSAL
jgi:hypothetical protein